MPATTPGRYDGRIGVFGGVGQNQYFRNNVTGHPELLARVGDYPLLLATEREYAITRVAYKLGLKGPAIEPEHRLLDVGGRRPPRLAEPPLGRVGPRPGGRPAGSVSRRRAATSTRRTASHHRTAIAGRSTRTRAGPSAPAARRWSSSSACPTPSRTATRSTPSSGARRSTTTARAKIGFTAPSIDGQAAVIEEALAVADVDPDTIGYGRGPRHRHVARRSDRDRGADAGLPSVHEPAPVLRDRLAEDEHRPPRRRGRGRRDHQGGAGPAPRADPAEPQLPAAESRRSTSAGARSS